MHAVGCMGALEMAPLGSYRLLPRKAQGGTAPAPARADNGGDHAPMGHALRVRLFLSCSCLPS